MPITQDQAKEDTIVRYTGPRPHLHGLTFRILYNDPSRAFPNSVHVYPHGHPGKQTTLGLKHLELVQKGPIEEANDKNGFPRRF